MLPCRPPPPGLHPPTTSRARPPCLILPHAPPRRPLPRHPPPDAQPRVAAVLDLRPGAAAPARLVDAVEPLGDHALKPLRAARLDHLRSVAGMVGRRAPRGPLQR